MTKKEIILNGEKWIVDFETGTIYKNLEMIPNGTGTLPMLGRYGDYPFKVFRNALYFETNDKFYKVYADEVMENMNSYERRIVHNCLTNMKGITTISEGEEPNRHVIIKPTED